ncbi:Carboxylesterase family protein [Colletotrichum higginsianum IMI 349063]|uniref:Carboxylesterase family protein n=1 Tax=Colletotrichum higginsianum (strain IMI 349063) TaxID=759273 RepID=A0A1B7XV51_COLHI|nr:Carboxylesterase family protein [Colletotrichum higginsianum IMI 349063]OBR03657.1 Carboxylesterase family protein [Colletotrichum higginsianum IMI 349063]
MGRLSRSMAAAQFHGGFGVLEGATTSCSGLNASIDATIAPSYNYFTVNRNRDTNNDRSTPDFIDSLTAKLRELHIYSPQKNRADRSLLHLVRPRLPQLTIDTKTVPTLSHIREDAQYCTTSSTVTTSAQGPLSGELPHETERDEGIPSSAETTASSTVPFRQAPDLIFEASEPSFPSRVFHAADLSNHSLVTDTDFLTSIARHQAGQYDYVLSVLDPDSTAKRDNLPKRRGGLTVDFGCNVLVQADRTWGGICNQSKPANAYKLLATPLVTEDVAQDTSQLSRETDDMAVTETVVRSASPTPFGEAAMNSPTYSALSVSVVERGNDKESSLDYVEDPKDRVISISTDMSSEPVVEAPRTPSRSVSSGSRSRIEDSVEAIDRLEEELEAVNIAARLATPSKSSRNRSKTDDSANTATTVATSSTTIKRTASTLKRTQSTGAGAKPAPRGRAAERKTASTVNSDATKASPGKGLTRKSTATRPTSLLPPKPPSKSTKAPTKPSFELPGEAVARRIKEQRDARLAQQAEKAAPQTPQRTRSLKVPTRPNFELPGEAISQRKRAEREARLKAQEEEERKRREFKARPIKAKLGSAAYPRETLTSRARQNKGSEASIVQVEESPSKRTSMLGIPHTLVRASPTRSPQTRGRGTSQTAAANQASRATSTSTGSMSGKRSTLSDEDLEQQRLKGREIFQRDNCYIEDKERERREREWNAKMAREQAAERSRQASREWAEKQKRKQLAAVAAMAGQAA